MLVPKLAETIADQWRGLKKFANDLAAQLPTLTRRGDRGLKQNLAILERWLRAALLKLAEQIELPARKQNFRPKSETPQTANRRDTERRPGFRCIDPDADEKARAAENRFDISSVQSGGCSRAMHDPRPSYRRRLEAIGAVLEAPERYAQRVKRKLEARKKRPNITRLAVTHRSALPDLLQVPRHSDLGRYIWYNDSS